MSVCLVSTAPFPDLVNVHKSLRKTTSLDTEFWLIEWGTTNLEIQILVGILEELDNIFVKIFVSFGEEKKKALMPGFFSTDPSYIKAYHSYVKLVKSYLYNIGKRSCSIHPMEQWVYISGEMLLLAKVQPPRLLLTKLSINVFMEILQPVKQTNHEVSILAFPSCLKHSTAS
jgi:hypothetical protein